MRALSFKLVKKDVALNEIDIMFLILMAGLTVYYSSLLSDIHAPIWDGAVYLENAKDWLTSDPLYQIYRPPMLSWVISAIWAVTGEDWEFIKYLPAAFTLGAGLILYYTIRQHKGALFALGVTSLTMFNAQVLFWSTQIHAESLSLLFLALTVYFIKSKRSLNLSLAGVAGALTFASRYPIFLQAVVIVVVEGMIRKSPKLFARVMIGMVPVVLIVILVMFLKTGTFQASLEKDNDLSLFLSPFYILHAFDIWGYAIVLVPVALLFRRTYSDKYNYTFILWFVVSLLFWSANTSNHQERFAFQFTPAVSYLAILAIENIVKSDLVFFRRKGVVANNDPLGPSRNPDSGIKVEYESSEGVERIPVPEMPGFYRKEGELETIIYQSGSEDKKV